MTDDRTLPEALRELCANKARVLWLLLAILLMLVLP